MEQYVKLAYLEQDYGWNIKTPQCIRPFRGIKSVKTDRSIIQQFLILHSFSFSSLTLFLQPIQPII
jgi:hypothetical protein